MKDNKMKSSAEKITMPNEVKTRIISKCEELETSMNKTSDNSEYTEHVFEVERVKGRNILRTVSAVAACAVLVGGIGATGIYMNKQGRPHQSTEITDGTAVTTDAVTETATKAVATTEAVAETAIIQETEDLAELIEIATIPDYDLESAEDNVQNRDFLKYLAPSYADNEIIGGQLYYGFGTDCLIKLTIDQVNALKEYMEKCKLTELTAEEVEFEKYSIYFNVYIPYDAKTDVRIVFYENNVCTFTVTKKIESDSNTSLTELVEEHFFIIDSEAVLDLMDDVGYYYKEYDEHNLSMMPEGYVCPTPVFNEGDYATIDLYSGDEEAYICYYLLNEDEASVLYEFALADIEWSECEISENEEEMYAFKNGDFAKLRYNLRICAKQNGSYEMSVYTNGYITWHYDGLDDYMIHTYKLNDLELNNKLDELFQRENVLDNLDAMIK